MKEQLEELNPWWNHTYKINSIPRPTYLNTLKSLVEKKDIVILNGIRRVGKTTLLKLIIHSLLEKNLNPKHILFLSLDLLYLRDYSIQDIILEYKKMHMISHGQKVYLFLDEVTHKKEFSQELKNLYDLENYKIFASSSSAKLLKEKKSYLTGRARYIEIFPLDFQEFIIFSGYDHKSLEKHIIESLFDEYMLYGGMPEYILTKDPVYLSELIEMIIAKDIVGEHNIKNKQVVFDLLRLLCERVGKQVSYNKLSRILGVDNETISRYISHFLDTFLFSMVEMKGKLNQRILGKKKLYSVDVGIRNHITGFRDKGAVYENLVYNKIKNYKPQFLYQDGVEIDFIYKDTLIEAKYGQEMTSSQEKLFNNTRIKNKIVAQGVDFFL